MEEQYKSSFVRALAERWQFWRPMAVEKVSKMDRVPRMIIRSALDTFDIFNRMPEFLEKLDSDDKVRLVIEAEIKALAAVIEEAPMFIPSDDDTMGGTVEELEADKLPASEEVEVEETKPTEDLEQSSDIYPDISVYGQPEGKAKELSETGKHIADIWKDHGSDSLVEYAAPEKPEALDAEPTLKDVFKHQTEIEVPGKVAKPIEKPEPQYVQKFDDETQGWRIINKETGEVTNRKKSPGPYKNVPFMEEVKDAGDGEAGEQANTTNQAEDQQ